MSHKRLNSSQCSSKLAEVQRLASMRLLIWSYLVQIDFIHLKNT